MRKKFAIIAAVLAALVSAYAALGFLFAPRWLSRALVDIAEQRQLRLELQGISVNPFSLHIRLQCAALHDAATAGADRPFARLREASATLSWTSLWRGRVVVESVQLREPWVDVARLPQFGSASGPSSSALPALTVQDAQVDDGMLVLPDLPPVKALQVSARGVSTQKSEWGRFRMQAEFAGGELHSEGEVSPHQRALRDLTLRAVGTELLGVRVEQLSVEIAQLALPLQRVQLLGQVELRGGGRAAVAAHLEFPLQGTAAIELEAVPMRMLGRWLPQGLALTIVDGAASSDGLLHWEGGGHLPDRFDGSAVIDQLRIEARDSQRLLLAWQQARANGVQVQLAPLRVDIERIHIAGPAGRLIRQADGRINVAEAMNFPDRDAGTAAAGLPHVGIRELLVEGGRLEFADHALATPFEARFESLSGSMREFSTGAGEPARLSLDGRLDSGGSVRIEGEIDIDRPRSQVDIAALVRNLRLPPWSPYAARFAGYRIAAGEMSARLDYQIEAGQLRGSNRVVFERLRLGEKVEDRGLVDLPLDLIIALLSDANGCINLRIPVRGRVDDPNVALTSVLTQVLGDAIRGALAAPFRSLAAIFADTPGDRSAGGQRGQHVGAVLFAPGSVDLSKDGQDRLGRLAQTLRERPRLGLQVDAGFSSGADQAGIRQRIVRRDIAREAGLKGPDAVDWSDPKVVQAAERLYMQRVGSRLEMLRLRGQVGSYVDELQQQLAVTVSAAAENAQELAELRAQRVQASLVDRGIASTRIQLSTSARPASKSGVPTALSLTARPSGGAADPLNGRDAGSCPLPGPSSEGGKSE